MKRKNLSALLLIAMLAVVNPSCKKEDKENNASRLSLLTTGQWRMVAFTVSPAVDMDFDGTPESDVYATYDACQKDDYVIFRTDGKAELNEGASKCYSADPQTELIDWAFVNDEKEIIIDGDRATIQELTASRFRISLPMAGTTAEVTFSH